MERSGQLSTDLKGSKRQRPPQLRIDLDARKALYCGSSVVCCDGERILVRKILGGQNAKYLSYL